MSASRAMAATMSFGGTVVDVGELNEGAGETLRRFTVNVETLGYMTRGSFGRHSEAGAKMSEAVRRRGSVCMLNGELMAARPFAKALRPGMWGWVYESSWCDLYTLPAFKWGEVVSHNAGRDEFVLRQHRTGGTFHLKANPPIENTIEYADTTFELEGKPSKPAEALRRGHWVQVHPARDQLIDVRTKASAFDSDELLPYWRGQRGYSNNLTAPATLRGFAMNPSGSVKTLEVTRWRKGSKQDITFHCSPGVYLDGRLAPGSVALRVGRPMVLVHYRSHGHPHHVYLWRDHDTVRGIIDSVDLKAGKLNVSLTDRLTGEKTGKTRMLKIDAKVLPSNLAFLRCAMRQCRRSLPTPDGS